MCAAMNVFVISKEFNDAVHNGLVVVVLFIILQIIATQNQHFYLTPGLSALLKNHNIVSVDLIGSLNPMERKAGWRRVDIDSETRGAALG